MLARRKKTSLWPYIALRIWVCNCNRFANHLHRWTRTSEITPSFIKCMYDFALISMFIGICLSIWITCSSWFSALILLCFCLFIFFLCVFVEINADFSALVYSLWFFFYRAQSLSFCWKIDKCLRHKTWLWSSIHTWYSERAKHFSTGYVVVHFFVSIVHIY